MSEGGLLPPIVLELRAKAGELKTELAATKAELSELQHHTESSTSGMSKAFTKAAGYGKTLTVGLAGAAVAVGGFAVESAMSAEVVDAKLAAAIKNAGGNMEELDPKISKVDATLRRFGFTNDQTNTALTAATVALKSPEKGLQAVSVAADLARAKNIDLSTATLMVSKAMEGQTRPLKALGIDLPVYNGNAQAVKLAQMALAKAQQNVNDILAKTPDAVNPSSKAHMTYEKALRAVDAAHQKLADTQNAGKTIMAALEQRVHGMASAYGNTLQGKIAAAKAGVEAMGETLGKKLIPVITSAIGVAQSFVGWLGSHTPVLYTLAAVVGTVVVAAITAYIASLVTAAATSAWSFAKMVASGAAWAASQAANVAKAVAAGAVWIAEHVAQAAVAVVQYGLIAAAATAAFIAENAATLGIIAVIALLVAAIVFLATHWKEVWAVIKAAAEAVWNWLKGAWSWISSVFFAGLHAALGALKAVWSAVWGGIKAAASAVWDWLKTAVSWIISGFFGAIRTYLSILGSVWGAVWGGIKSVASGVWSVISGIWNGIKGGIQALGGVISWFGALWSSIWNGVSSAVSAVWNFISPIINTIKGAISGVMSVVHGIGSAIGGVGHFLFGGSHANGGWIPGSKGQPSWNINHGGEYMLSTEMLAGRQQVDPKVLTQLAAHQSMSAMAMLGGGSAKSAPTGGGSPSVVVNAQTNASPSQIASTVGWQLRAMA